MAHKTPGWKINMKKHFLVLTMILLLGAICLAGMISALYIKITRLPFSSPTTTFNQRELFGTWEARYGSNQDFISINEDGFFKQKYIGENNYIFLSDKNKWSLEYFPDGRIRLHLAGARYYYAGVSFFEYNTTNLILYDPFSKTVVDLKDELILTLVYKNSGQLILHQMLRGPDEGFPIFDTGNQYFQKMKQ